MPTIREQLRRMVTERDVPPRGFAWAELMEALEELEDAAKPLAAAPLEGEDVSALVELLNQKGRLPMRGQTPATHSMPPEELLQLKALKILEQAGRIDRAQDVLERLDREPGSPALKAMARRLLNRGGGEEPA
ncbi:hypothetical protein OWM54_01850 [Myxococcus sp. MISCRS1]|uniref:hypothetical protein n=1 Tax=Myxococcus TaxID=32 RepID=UPI001144DDE7|nr:MULTISPECIES: hypothetical protein [Myxococcus]MBZ4399353.1 hypothetical protein [Myxococcus sp. AS-1-15]MCK8504029.1 hypothetical protein [Myxococcus fulvus]MCY0995875.1 hypothetical protein [Myxococcus sp. MISCRS1]